MRRLSPILFICLLWLTDDIHAQVPIKTPDDWNFAPRREVSLYEGNWKKIDIPFQFINKLIIIEILLENTFPLRFVFDTGAEHSVLTERSFTDILGKTYEREFTLYGADMKSKMLAYLVRDIHFKIDKLNAPYQSILVLDKDYINFGQVVGLDIHGILGASFFKQFVIKINYQRKVITLIRPDHFKPSKKDKRIDIEVFRGKPYLHANIDMIGLQEQRIKLLLDTGAGLSLLLHTDTDTTLTIPPNAIKGNVGRGLGGQVEGFQGRVRELSIGEFEMGRVIANFQKLDSLYIHDKSLLNDRNGILGNTVLSRFDVTLDYWNEQLYLHPNKSFKTDFRFDRSGLVVVASGVRLKTYNVQYVHPNSPADKVGIQAGDIIKSVNGKPATLLTLEIVINTLRKKVGKKIRLVLLRDGKRLKKEFYLEEII